MAILEANTHEASLDFVDTLASCVHDIKNAAGVLMNAADALAAADTDMSADPHVASLQTEARHINNNLMHLLGLYKFERSESGINRDIVDCDELLLELEAHNDALIASRGLVFAVRRDEELIEGYFDRELVTSILNAAINNAQRYARGVVGVSAVIEDGYTVLRVDDDGDGYPASVLESNGSEFGKTSYRAGSTGLGLFFARKIAAMHHHRNRVGRVTLSNEGIDGGARFGLWLP